MATESKTTQSVTQETPPALPRSLPPPKGPAGYVLAAIIGGAIVLAVAAFWGGHLQNFFSRHAEQAPATQAAANQWYTCGMHPQVILPKPGLCPICHMTLTPIANSKLNKEIKLNPAIVQNIGVRIAAVTSGPVTRTIRTVGAVDYDETAVRDITTKFPGWLEKLYADTTGAPVEKGQPLFEVYSPDLYNAQTDYLLAVKDASSPGGQNLLSAVKKRLQLFDINDEQIAALEKAGTPSRNMTIYSPVTGLVVKKDAVEGLKFEAGTLLYSIADLSHVWVMVTMYEYQLPFVSVDQPAIMTLPYVPGQKFLGKVKYIYPYLSAENRQVKVRLEFPNPNLQLKPGMFANVELQSTLAKNRVLVPREAVMDTGSRQVAFVSLGEGRFEPRNVRIGVEAEDGKIEILDGLKPGEMVVTSGEFLLDSEARLRESMAKMIKGEMASEQKAQVAVRGVSELKSLPDAAATALAKMIGDYTAIQSALAGDTTKDVGEHATQLAAGMDDLLKVEMPGDGRFWLRHEEAAEVRGKALELASAAKIEDAREKFADLTIKFTKLLRATGVPSSFGKEVQELHCPMYRAGQGGTYWLQLSGAVRNPYYGKQMLDCFDERTALPVTGAEH